MANEVKAKVLHSVTLDDGSYVLLSDALHYLRRTDHDQGCPRLRDDYGCQCGLDDVIAALADVVHTQDEQYQLNDQYNQQAQQAIDDEE